MMPLDKEIQNLPDLPGVYLMLDKKNSAIYIGKAKNIRKRVRSYFGGAVDSRPLAKFFIPQVIKIDYLVTDTEKEALILENNLIKKHRPKYNIDLKDDKTHFSLKLTFPDKFPKLILIRNVKKDGARYFGPYSSSQAVRETLKSIHYLFPLRTCRNSEFKNRTRPCLNFQIGKCLAPCMGKIGEEEYQEYVKGVTLFLEKKNRELLKLLKAMMEQESEQLKFEEAARLRDRIASIEKTIEKQKIVSSDMSNRDIFGIFRREYSAGAAILFIREGKLLDINLFHFSNLSQSDEEMLSSLIHQFYEKGKFIPREVIIPFPIEDKTATEEWLGEQAGKKVFIVVPMRGEKLGLLKMAEKNAKQYYLLKQKKDLLDKKTLGMIKNVFNLRRLPLKIACVDISNIKGEMATGSLVSFVDGKPDKKGYRHYKIKTVSGIDDYGMMHEVLMRYLSKLPPEGLPDLLLVDGGKGQLNVALSVLKELKIEGVDTISLAKAEKGGRLSRVQKKLMEERFFLPRRKEPLFLPKNSAALFLLQRVRDESHRFAISYHRKLRKKRDYMSVLDRIPGIGPIKKKELIKRFGSIEKIKGLSKEEILSVPKISRNDAGELINFFRQKQQ